MLAKPPLGRQIDFAHPLARGLVFAMPLNEGAGQRVNDLSGYRVGLTGTGLQWQPSRLGKSVYFDGNASIVANETRRHLSGFTRGFTVCGWVRVNATGQRRVLWAVYDSSIDQRAWMVDYGLSSKLQIYISEDGVGYRVHYVAYPWELYTWHHISVIWRPDAYPDGGVAGRPRFIVDGVDIGSNTSYNNTSILAATTPLYIGAVPFTTGRTFVGGIADTLIYNRALRLEEIRQVMRDPYILYRQPSKAGLYAPTIESPEPPTGFKSFWIPQNRVIGAA